MPSSDSKDSSASDNSDNPRVLLKRADHHNCRCNTLTQFLINDDAKDSDLMEIDLEKLQAVQNGWSGHSKSDYGPFTQYLREENDHDDKELLKIDLSKIQSLPQNRKEHDATPKINLANTNANKSESAAVQLTMLQRQHMEENRAKAVAKRKAKGNPPFHAT